MRYMFGSFFDQPLIDGHIKLFFEYPPKGGDGITEELCQLFGLVGFPVVCHDKVCERHVVANHRIEERLQFFGLVILAKQVNEFTVLHSPEVRGVRTIGEVVSDALHEGVEGFVREQFAAVFGRAARFAVVSVQIGDDTVFGGTNEVVEGMDNDCESFITSPRQSAMRGRKRISPP